MKSLLLAGLTLVAADAAPSISAADKAQGARADVRLRRAYGGRYDGPQADYVRAVGRRVAARSGLSSAENDFTVTLLDSPVENAFALPGGYVYVTRQLLALMNSEAQLASVLGHEVGHVAARHAAAQRRTERIGYVLARVVDAVAGDDALGTLIGRSGHIANALYALRYSRDQEYAADRLGLGYATAAGYSPYAAAGMLAQLDAGATLRARIDGRDAVPTWASTHPNGAERVRRAAGLAAATGQADAPAAQDTAFLRRLDGLRYDDDPGDGVIRGQVFEQPRLRFRFTAPEGYALKRVGRVVHVAGPEGQAWLARTLPTHDPAIAVARSFRSLGLHTPDAVQRGVTSGIPWASAAMPSRMATRAVDVTVVAYRLAAATVRLDMLTPRGTGMGALRPMVDSVAPLTEAEAAAIPGRRLRIDTVAPGDDMDTFAARMAYPDHQRERFLTLNGLDAKATLRPGMLVKVVVAG